MSVHDESAEGSIDREIADARLLLDNIDDTVEEFAARKQATDRSRIAIIIVILFAVCLILLIALVLVGAISGLAWNAAADFILDIVKTMVLPVVTLVLGFYFGSAKR